LNYGEWVVDILLLTTTLYLSQIGGEMPGLYNTILKPKAILGIEEKFTIGHFNNHLDINTLYGKTVTGRGTTNSQLQELHGQWTLLYPLYQKGPETFQVGVYTSVALPFHSRTPYIHLPSTAYSNEENEVIKKEFLVGTDFNFNFSYDKVDSSLHNIIFFHGKKVAPNLLAYQPLYALDWCNSFYFLGDVAHPKLQLSTEMKFWFAKKAGVSIINTHDGIGGTKREFDYNIRLLYFLNKHIDTYVTAYGYNNLNRGESVNDPHGFRDGYGFGFEYRF
jgi:hypothetical protein